MNFSIVLDDQQNSTYKVLEFDSAEQKANYVEAENKDSKCIEAYFQYQAARTPTQRLEARKHLLRVRYAFYKKWMAKIPLTDYPNPIQCA